jgi:peptide deformylase
MKQTIVTVHHKKDEKFLREKTEEFDISRLKDKKQVREIKELIRKMRETMKEANGVGLSANQIGIPERFFVAQVPDAQGKQKFYVVFNPELSKKSKETETVEEGCLSVPEMYGPTERHYEITLTGYDINGKKIKIKAWGLLARVFQHEVGHLDGKLFTDIAKEVHQYIPPENTKR